MESDTINLKFMLDFVPFSISTNSKNPEIPKP